jgi:hypothetical protein
MLTPNYKQKRLAVKIASAHRRTCRLIAELASPPSAAAVDETGQLIAALARPLAAAAVEEAGVSGRPAERIVS